MTLPITPRSLLARTFASTLYIHPTRDIGRKSLSLCELFTFGIKAINVELITFVHFSLQSNSTMNLIKSSFIKSQNSFINPKLMSSRTELFKLSQSHTSCFTSSTENGLLRMPPSPKDSLRKGRPPTPDRSAPMDLK